MNSPFYDITQYGAKGIARPVKTLEIVQPSFKWVTLQKGKKTTIYGPEAGAEYDSVAIQKAIDAAHAAGGGTVYVPGGHYLIAPLRLLSNVILHLAPGANLWGSPELDDYRIASDVEQPAYGHASGYNREKDGMNDGLMRLITAEFAENCGITGAGCIHAQAAAWVIPWLNSNPTTKIKDRPSDTMLFHKCRKVRLEGISLVHTPNWSIVFDQCSHVFVRGICLRSYDTINSDGIDLVNSSHVHISDCDIHAMDDGICLKNTIPDFTMSNITVTNCSVRSLCNGLKIGTDSLGNFEDIVFSNIVLRNDDDDVGPDKGGINLCALDGGYVRNISFANIVMHNVTCPFFLVVGKRTVQQKAFREPRSGRMENITITGIQAMEARYPCFIVGQPDSHVRGVTIRDVRTHHAAKERAPLYHESVEEKPEQYPQPFMFGSREEGDMLPASGLYMRHADEVFIQNFSHYHDSKDERPWLSQENTDEIVIRDCTSRPTSRPLENVTAS